MCPMLAESPQRRRRLVLLIVIIAICAAVLAALAAVMSARKPPTTEAELLTRMGAPLIIVSGFDIEHNLQDPRYPKNQLVLRGVGHPVAALGSERTLVYTEPGFFSTYLELFVSEDIEAGISTRSAVLFPSAQVDVYVVRADGSMIKHVRGKYAHVRYCYDP